MSLTLKVVTYKGQLPKAPTSFSFGQEGGTIGRSDKCDFILPDPDRYISRHHATIVFDHGSFLLEDKSLAGVYIRTRKLWVHQNRAILEDGDIIEIGDYELLVKMERLDQTECLFFTRITQKLEDDPAGANPDPLFAVSAKQSENDKNIEQQGDFQKKYDDFESAVRWINEKMSAEARKPEPGKNQNDRFPSEISDIFAVSEGQEAAVGDSQLILLKEIGELLNNDERALQDDPPFEINTDLIIDAGPESLPAAFEDQPEASDQKEPEENIDLHDDWKSSEAHWSVPFRPSLSQVDISGGGAHESAGEPAGAPEIKLPASDAEIREHVGGHDRDQVSAGTVSSQRALFDLFLKGAGIADNGFYTDEHLPELMSRAGALLRELVKGLVELTNGRAESKNQLRMEGTILGATDNNPLKFSDDLSNTLKLLLTERQAGYLSGIQSVQESHADIMSHQLAMTVGIQAALKKALERFNPESYAQQYRKSLFFLKKAKCWDAFCGDYRNKVIETLENFLDDEFVRAYEEQVEKLGRSSDES